MTYEDEHIQDWPDEITQAAKRVLAPVLNDRGRLPLPIGLHAALQSVRVAVTKGHVVANDDLLNLLARAYSAYVLIEQAGSPSFYYGALRKRHKLRRTDGDPIALVLRSIHTLPLETEKDRKAARYHYATWATAIRHLIKEGIAPDQIAAVGKQEGQSVTRWVSKHRSWRRETHAKVPATKLSRPNRPLADLFGKQVKNKGDRALVEIQLTGNTSGRFNIIHARALPRGVPVLRRNSRWKRICEAINDHPPSQRYASLPTDPHSGEGSRTAGAQSRRPVGPNKPSRKMTDKPARETVTAEHRALTFQRRRQYRDAYRELINDLDANYFITFNFGYTINPQNAFDQMKGFCAALESKALGHSWDRRTGDERLVVVGFAEHLDSNPHWHAVARVPPAMVRTLETEGKKIWLKYAKRGQLDIERTKDPKKVKTYVSKRLHQEGGPDKVFIYCPELRNR